ncbi:TetR/AcrR family transcriptional regulator [Rathayibacter toxicus]|nr:TetR/AcrR family transcriptional regulator [Rathayibacter toxicus]QWL29491.1 TetR/AcrR family transcriptional regulator [Rathayibacter toxicus]QWL48360.1 TetR/AcrR family transcriptional regulator [Rathayibacter toxicus]QWL50424.1 TetR/AcrR family transcriptional regulator [Rathayibacter toxicus]QWL52756.1 TetR/AcrR family transcriptional regulator [Rathayibacter toxicus]
MSLPVIETGWLPSANGQGGILPSPSIRLCWLNSMAIWLAERLLGSSVWIRARCWCACLYRRHAARDLRRTMTRETAGVPRSWGEPADLSLHSFLYRCKLLTFVRKYRVRRGRDDMTDPRLTRSRELLLAAMTDALDREGDNQPSITELCAAAGVSRPTFYQHFGDVPSLIEAASVARMHALFAAVTSGVSPKSWEGVVPHIVHGLLEGLLVHNDFYCRVLNGGTARAVQESVVAFLAQRLLTFSPLAEYSGDDASVERFATFLAAGTTWLVVGWLLDGSARRPVAEASADIAELLVTAVASSPRAAPPSPE